ncbi:putative tRNA methyltransferase 10-like B isoform X1 [Apostichopus japonicus]|uniref:tRNA methyltransferase 10 homolog B n=1 Tax=Stichopus japonicus TaxID=307972 RepID=A0A2G8KP63_STIJA|nr:putative tRNA methyltransferase 10-like B isoform X1 [Apostichopus japonicus]
MDCKEEWLHGLMQGYWSSDTDEDEVSCNKDNDAPSPEECNKLTRKSARRLERFERSKKWKKMKQKEKQQLKEQQHKQLQHCEEQTDSLTKSDKPTKKEIKDMINAKLDSVQRSETIPKICVDMGLTGFMSEKEIDRLAGQLRRLYGSNRRSPKPLHVTLTNLEPGSLVYQACERKNDGFRNYKVHMTSESHLDMFPLERITYLTPDSETVLTRLEEGRVYILGGLVDESPSKNYTLQMANQWGLTTARLPISEYLQHAGTGSYNKILSINQIFDILLNFYLDGDWTSALLAGIPRRKGFIPK